VGSPETLPKDVPKALADVAVQMSVFMAIGVWYSLLQVVVEGYKELDYQDNRIDGLLSQEEYVDALRRFRNATFHYQEDPISPKLLEFLTATESERWINQLNVAFRSFFEEKLRELGMEEMLATFGSRGRP